MRILKRVSGWGGSALVVASVVSAVNQAAESGDIFGSGATVRTFDSGVDTFHTLTTYAIWTPATGSADVPSSTPGTRALLVALFVGWGVRLARNRPVRRSGP